MYMYTYVYMYMLEGAGTSRERSLRSMHEALPLSCMQPSTKSWGKHICDIISCYIMV